ncbi:MAG TPA: chromosome segregation protein SMC [Cyanobacteria bacterium UBA12227]|nr:chromosome segregation protein SMC [Cyanobacteria bacterium UBA12227]HAX87974.1 chromosome segregation protein SMC [Cyanobacteria bacterium UBA11370]HBY78150.1 chromosome segregation protein SMC [Cyanobacteria bacterium UBA11148]
MLKSFRVKNFKAVQDSKKINLTPLTAFIGYNGSGKSSIIEALEIYQKIVSSGLDSAMIPWRGFENIRNFAVPHQPQDLGVERPYEANPIEFNLAWQNYQTTMTVTTGSSGDELFIQKESLTIKRKVVAKRTTKGEIYFGEDYIGELLDGQSMINYFLTNKFQIDIFNQIARWQFVNLNPYVMGSPLPPIRAFNTINLAKDGLNIGEYLLSIQKLDQAAFDGIIETLQYVLPYAHDLQPTLTSELERNVYLQLTESGFKVPGWLLSTGTLRIIALLALLRHPEPAPLIVIEEIENGLDPRTIHLIVEEIRNVVEAGKTQVILTTHSPYLLDLLSLSQIILVERDDTGQPVFSRPADQESLQEWSKKFGPGKLYTMNRLSQRG